MAKTYYLTFGTAGDPRSFPGLAPTFLTFSNNGSAVTPPAIAAVTGATGFYSFTWGTTTPIAFLADAATTSPGTSGRYVIGALDPNDRADEYAATLIAIGTSGIALGTTAVAIGQTTITQLIAEGATLVGMGNTLSSTSQFGATLAGIGNTVLGIGGTLTGIGAILGTASSSIGSTSIDPTTAMGFLIRAQELREGNQTYTKATGVLDLFSRGATLLREKTISDTSTQTTKT